MNIELTNVSKKYGDKVIFDSLSFSFKENEIHCIMGPSGVGKTTLVRMISKLTDYEGNITNVDKVSYIFQEDRLIPSLTVYQNLDYVIKGVYKDKDVRKEIINSILEKMELKEYSNYYPKELSGGMAQRVSIARAFIYPSTLLIMDEPFKQMDKELKDRIIKEFLLLLKENKKTILYITHDLEEAKSITKNIYVIENKSTIRERKE